MLSVLTDRQWLWIAAGFYLAGFVLGTRAVLRERRHPRVAMYGVIAAGYALQTLGLWLRGQATHGCPLGNTFEIFQFTAWSATTLFLVVGATFRLSLLGYFTSTLMAALTLVSLAIPSWDATRRANIFGGNPWLELHAALALFAYGVFALLALTSLMYLFRNYSLRSKHLGGWFSFLPSIIDLDHICLRLLITGVGLLTASLAVGSVWWLRAPPGSVHAVLATVAVWLAYAVALGSRLRGRLIAQRFAWICVALFAAALISLETVDHDRRPAPANQAVSLQP
ncbi:MAG TPA: cytochrome c biogenesis protein CcsA [Opitutaceae bacterium]|jgi:HemX protein|nr:cytochrome c biogenesis protein CcsA [Opitutaceae bacterium]